ncbi:TPA: glycosyltransferase family 2 protein [Streptococcus suis]|nr:glycosyltransferase family 2 protein [Streptococcus suis]HEM6156756.1 glycosyltransferase family 2 protein [Streptococcus suis]
MKKNIETSSISVVIPAYNSENIIIRALESVRLQTRLEYINEIIVVNDGSTDATALEVERYATKYPELNIRLINQENTGVSRARNIGMFNATGTWIALLDSDDEWFENKVERQVEEILKNDAIDFIGGNHTSSPISILGRKIDTLHRVNIQEICIKMFPQTSTVLFKKSIFDEIGGYDETRHYAEDGQYFLRICHAYGYYYLPEQNVHYDRGKRGFGEQGLSGNLKGMQEGNRLNFKELLKQKKIPFSFYVALTIFDELKYLRRILLSMKK